jgi:thioredoxin-like negative regulator of GroEL
MTTISSASGTLDVVCLCAGWCNNCTAYRPLFDSLQAQFEGRARLHWLDIEDEAEVVGDLDIETFPTMLIMKGDVPLFMGPLTPQAGVLVNLVQSALDQRLVPLADADTQALARKVHQHLS